jgi:hypothetical protein
MAEGFYVFLHRKGFQFTDPDDISAVKGRVAHLLKTDYKNKIESYSKQGFPLDTQTTLMMFSSVVCSYL